MYHIKKTKKYNNNKKLIMPRRGRGITEFRDTKLYLTAAGSVGAAAVLAPIDAYKAAIRHLEGIEAQYALNGFTDLAGVACIIAGAINHQVHVFTVTTTVATGVYSYVYVETVPAPEDVS